MFTGRYFYHSTDWRIDLRAEFSTPNAEIINISGDIFQCSPGAADQFYSSFSMEEYPVPAQLAGASIQHKFRNRIFATQGNSRRGTPEYVEAVFSAALNGNAPTVSVHFYFRNPPPAYPDQSPYLCSKDSIFLRHLEVHVYVDQFNFPIPFPLPRPPLFRRLPKQPKDPLKAIFHREKILLEYANGGPVLLDRDSPAAAGWRPRDLHDLMINMGFDPEPTDPVWKIWSFVTDRYDLSEGNFISLAGYSFDNFGERHRQGIALFLNDSRFNGLDQPRNKPPFKQAINALLFTLTHELGHALGLGHTDPFLPTPGAVLPDLMNQDFTMARGDNWKDFKWAFIPEEGQLLRHGSWVDAAPGSYGAAFASGQRRTGAATPGLKLRICSQKVFLCTEPLEIEVRLRCTGEKETPVYVAFAPGAGFVSYQFRPVQTRRWQAFIPGIRVHGQASGRTLLPEAVAGDTGQDRVSSLVQLFFGAQTIPVLEAGEYAIRAEYRDPAGRLAYSNTHTVRIIGADYPWAAALREAPPAFRAEFWEFCYLNGSAERRFSDVRMYLLRTLRQLKAALAGLPGAAEKMPLLRLQAKIERLLGISLATDQWAVQHDRSPRPDGGGTPSRRIVRQPTSPKRYEKAIRRMNNCIRFFQRHTQSKRQNFAYRRVLEEQLNVLNTAKQPGEVEPIAFQMRDELPARGVPPAVIQDLLSGQTSLATV